MKKDKQIRILIIDKNKELSSQMAKRLAEYKFEVREVSDEQEITSYLKKSKNKIDLIILNTDILSESHTNIFETISSYPEFKIILVSSDDEASQREEYFAQGIIDYHLLNKKLDYIIDDIAESVYSLYTNNNETILVIDNSETLCVQIATMLQSRNYKVLIATSLNEGLEILKNNEISLLILDMNLQEISSLNVLEGLRDMYLLNSFFVLALSDDEHPSVVRDALKGGAKDFLKKPFLNEEFILKVDILVQSSRTKKIIIEQNEQIEYSLKQFKELLDASIGAMFIFEKNICINCNNEAVSFLEYSSKNEILNKEIFEIFNKITDDHKNDILDNKIDHFFEETIFTQKGKKYYVQFKERNIDIDNKLLKIIAVLNITDLKKQEKILVDQTKMASMGEMIGNISHQWRQPLCAISIAAGGIKLNYEFEIEEREETIKELDNIVENTKFLSETIESFQNFLKADKTTTTFEVTSTIQKTLAIVNANLQANNINVIQHFHETFNIQGIENELVQVFLNIFNNAADIFTTLNTFSNEKYILISAEKNNNNLIINIQDNAGGIPSEIINKIFEPYFTTKHQTQGTGLGLYMTHQIIENMNGILKVENKTFIYGEKEYYGANFIIELPLDKEGLVELN